MAASAVYALMKEFARQETALVPCLVIVQLAHVLQQLEVESAHLPPRGTGSGIDCSGASVQSADDAGHCFLLCLWRAIFLTGPQRFHSKE